VTVRVMHYVHPVIGALYMSMMMMMMMMMIGLSHFMHKLTSSRPKFSYRL